MSSFPEQELKTILNELPPQKVRKFISQARMLWTLAPLMPPAVSRRERLKALADTVKAAQSFLSALNQYGDALDPEREEQATAAGYLSVIETYGGRTRALRALRPVLRHDRRLRETVKARDLPAVAALIDAQLRRGRRRLRENEDTYRELREIDGHRTDIERHLALGYGGAWVADIRERAIEAVAELAHEADYERQTAEPARRGRKTAAGADGTLVEIARLFHRVFGTPPTTTKGGTFWNVVAALTGLDDPTRPVRGAVQAAKRHESG